MYVEYSIANAEIKKSRHEFSTFDELRGCKSRDFKHEIMAYAKDDALRVRRLVS